VAQQEEAAGKMGDNPDHGVRYEVNAHASDGALVEGMAAYEEMYAESVRDPPAFWAKQARELLEWERPFESVMQGSFEGGDLSWFAGGKINASVQCVDRHVNAGKGEDIALIWEGDEVGHSKKFTYREVLNNVCRIANVMKRFGVRKGDAVTIYMPMVPEVAFTMLACVRIGAPHSVVFAGFSAGALRDRIVDVASKYVFTCDEGLRGGRVIPLKKVVNAALDDCDIVTTVFTFRRTGTDVPMIDGRDVWMEAEVERERPFCPAETCDAEDTMFYLYTSGSTGKPKGVAHTTGGYMLYTTITHKYVFDYRPGDVYACVADCGWITGHSYIVYGPLSNGATTVMFESTPLYPDAGRYWDLVERYKVTQFYTVSQG